MKHSIIKTLTFISFLSFSFISCLSSNELISEDLTSKQLIQNGQTAFEKEDFKNSLRYYNAVLERYPEDLASCLEAKYEIGHLFMKQKKYSKAKPIFQEIISLYSNTMPGQIPAAFERLSKIELSKIPE